MITIEETAKSYITAAERCEEQRPINENQYEMLLVPSITNRAFAVELYMKALALMDGNTLKGHKLEELFFHLSERNRSAIIAECGVEKNDFLSKLKENSCIFVDWRYAFEKSNIQVSWHFLQKFSYSVKKCFENAFVLNECKKNNVTNPHLSSDNCRLCH